MNRFVSYSYKDNIARTYYGTINISYESAYSYLSIRSSYKQTVINETKKLRNLLKKLRKKPIINILFLYTKYFKLR